MISACEWQVVHHRVLHCGIMSMSGSSNNQRIEAGLGECIGVVLICALLLLFEQFGFLAATFVSPMMPASVINAVIPSLSAVFLKFALYFCKSLTISKNTQDADGAKAFSSSQPLIMTSSIYFFEKSLNRFLASVTCSSNKSGSGRRCGSNIASQCKLTFRHCYMVPTWLLLCRLGSNKYDNQLQSRCNHVR